MQMLPDKPGSDITIISCLYYEPFKHKGEYTDDVFIIVYRDANDKKQVHFIPRPVVDIYFAKPEFRDFVTPRIYFPAQKVYTVETRHTRILDAIAKEIRKDKSEVGKSFLEIANRAYDTRNNNLKKELYKYPYSFFADIDLESRYRMNIGRQYNLQRPHFFRQCFFDIEADMYDENGRRYTENEIDILGLNRINMISALFTYNPKTQEDDRTLYLYTLALKDYKKYKGQEKFFSDKEKLYQDCLNVVNDITVTVKKKKYNLLERVGMKIKFVHLEFDTEEEVLINFWNLMHAAAPDTASVWNIAYDIPKIMARIGLNGYDPVEIMSHKGFDPSIRFIDCHIDTRPGIEACNKTTRIQMTNLTTFICQMNLYAGMNKGRKDYGSLALDNIGRVEAGLGKWQFSKKGVTVLDAPIKLYREFYLYSIFDVLLQYIIEYMTSHVQQLMLEMNATDTSPYKINKLNTYLRNVYYDYYIEHGYVPGNNKNADYARNVDADTVMDLIEQEEFGLTSDEEDEETDEEREDRMREVVKFMESDFCDSPFKKHSLKAGLVADPNLNTAVGAMLFDGVRSCHIFPDSMDMDYRAHYPTATIVNNISDPTQFGRIVIKKRLSDRQNPYKEEKYVPGGEYAYDILSGDMISVGNVWHNLGTTEDLLKELDKETLDV